MAIEKGGLPVEEVCRILDASAKAGVTELTFGSLHVKFGRTAENVVGVSFPDHSYPFVHHDPRVSAPVKNLTEDQHKQQTKDSIEADELLLREDQLARALVEDPVRYEELLMQGELGDELDRADDADDE